MTATSLRRAPRIDHPSSRRRACTRAPNNGPEAWTAPSPLPSITRPRMGGPSPQDRLGRGGGPVAAAAADGAAATFDARRDSGAGHSRHRASGSDRRLRGGRRGRALPTRARPGRGAAGRTRRGHHRASAASRPHAGARPARATQRTSDDPRAHARHPCGWTARNAEAEAVRDPHAAFAHCVGDAPGARRARRTAVPRARPQCRRRRPEAPRAPRRQARA